MAKVNLLDPEMLLSSVKAIGRFQTALNLMAGVKGGYLALVVEDAMYGEDAYPSTTTAAVDPLIAVIAAILVAYQHDNHPVYPNGALNGSRADKALVYVRLIAEEILSILSTGITELDTQYISFRVAMATNIGSLNAMDREKLFWIDFIDYVLTVFQIYIDKCNAEA